MGLAPVASSTRFGQSKRRALSVDEIVKKYAICPVNWLSPEVLRGGMPTEASDVYGLGLVLWEMLYRTIPFGDFSIAQIIGAVGYGVRTIRAVASSTASTETTFLHEVVNICTRRESTARPRVDTLLASLRDAAKDYERRRSQRSALEKMSDKTEKFAFNLMAGKLPSLYGSKKPKVVSTAVPTFSAAGTTAGQSQNIAPPVDDGPRMLRLESGDWVRVDFDLVEQFPDDEEKWRTLMTFRAKLSGK